MNYREFLLFSLCGIAGVLNQSAYAGGRIKYRSVTDQYQAESSQQAHNDRIRKEESQGLTRVYLNEYANTECVDALIFKDLPFGLEVAFDALFTEEIPTVPRSYGPNLNVFLDVETDQILTSLITGYTRERRIFKVFIKVSSPEQKKSVVNFLESRNRIRELRALIDKKYVNTGLIVYFVEKK